MKTGMFTCGHQRLPIEHAFRDASELGYDGIEIWGGRPHAFAPDLKAGGIKQIKALAQTYQMPIIGYTPETNGYPYNMMLGDAPRDKCTLSCAINGIHAAFHYLKKNYISGCVMTVPTGW